MKKIIICIVFLLFMVARANSQTPKFNEWDDYPVMHDIPTEYLKEPAVIVLQDIKIDYKFDGDYLVMFRTVHKIIRILDNDGIELYNKVAIPVSHGKKILSVKARTILPNGKTIEIDREKIKRSQNENGGTQYVFAFEGVEKNTEVEYLEKDICRASFYGSEPMQFTIPVMHTFFEMQYPKEMAFEEKGYHGFPDAKDSLYHGKKHIKIYQPYIPALRDEQFSFYNLYRMRVEYKIQSFKSFHAGGEESKYDYTWDAYAKELYNEYCVLTDSQKRTINKFLTMIGIKGNEKEIEKLRKIESGIKSRIVLYPENDAVNDRFDSIMIKKTASEDGYVKLFAACFKMAGVKFEIGGTSNRYYHQVSSKFQNWAILNNFVFWFPSFNNFMDPTEVYLRYPVLPLHIINNKGIFVNVDNVGDAYAGLADIRTITSYPTAENQINVTTEVNFNDAMEPIANMQYKYTGYTTCAYRTQLALHPKKNEKQKEIIKGIVTIAEKQDDIIDYNYSGEGVDNYYKNSPFVLNATVKLPNIVDKGNNQTFLFNAGMLIGKCRELYHEKDRELPVDFNYPMIETHSITIHIPKDCKIENPEVLKMRVEYTDDSGKVNTSFITDYKLDTGMLTITTNELFSKSHFIVSDYPFFRSVVNAAADFNQVTLIMSRTKKKVSTVHKKKMTKLASTVTTNTAKKPRA